MSARAASKKANKKPQPPTPDAIAMGELFASLRSDRGVTQAELAARVGVHRNTIYNIERGADLPLSLYFQLCMALQTDPTQFFKLMIKAGGAYDAEG